MSQNFCNRLDVSLVQFRKGGPADYRSGLIGFVSFVLNGQILVDGITLRRTRTGRLTLSFPERRDKGGGLHPYLKPLNDDARLALEAQVFDALNVDPEAWVR